MYSIAMAKAAFHPDAYLSQTRNVERGLISRTKVLRVLERESTIASALAEKSTLNYGVVYHHLRLLEAEKIVMRKGKAKPFYWELTGIGQQRLKMV